MVAEGSPDDLPEKHTRLKPGRVNPKVNLTSFSLCA
jgi:hypothetical protein